MHGGEFLALSDVIDISSSSQHACTLYDNNSERDLSSINYINRGLEEKQLCIYASVNAYDDTLHLEKIFSQIKDYKENINKRNLLIVDLKPFYNSALKGDLTPFEDLYIQNYCNNLKIDMVEMRGINSC